MNIKALHYNPTIPLMLPTSSLPPTLLASHSHCLPPSLHPSLFPPPTSLSPSHPPYPTPILYDLPKFSPPIPLGLPTPFLPPTLLASHSHCLPPSLHVTENISLWEGVSSLKPNTYQQAKIMENISLWEVIRS